MRLLWCALLLACLASVSRAADSVVLLKAQSFQDDLAGWTRSGQAEFVADKAQPYNGSIPARITIAPGATLAFQQLQWRIADVAPDDELRGDVWIKTQGVTALPGAYVALEYLDDNGKRVGVEHGSGHVLDGANWQRVRMEGVAPKGVHSARLNLILHAHGTAWFAAPQLQRIRQSAGAEVKFQEIILNPQDAKSVIRDRFLGFGAEWDSHAYNANGITDADFALISRRIEWMRLPIVRIMMQAKWVYKGNNQFDWETPEMKSLYRHLDLCQRRGMSVILTDWGVEPQWLKTPGIADVGDAKYAEVIGTYMSHLIERKGYNCIKYFVMVNEPNWEVKEWSRWKKGVQNVYAQFQKRGLDKKVLFTGSDQSSSDSWHMMAVDQLQSTLGAYDIHRYVGEPQVRLGRIYDYYREMWQYALDKDPRARQKPFIVAESGVTGVGASSSQNPLTATPEYGVWMTDYAIQATNAGSSAVLTWMLDDNSHVGFTWGMWKSKKDNFALKPWFYTWSLLSRTVPPGSKIYRVAATNPKLRVLAAQLPATSSAASGWTFCLVNRGTSETTLNLKVSGAKTTAMNRYVFSPNVAAVDADGFPKPQTQTQVNLAQGLNITCPPDTVVLVTAVQ
jgi:hypothetical protein